MLHRMNLVKGFHLHAMDGEIGHVDDVLIDERTWRLQYLVIDTSNFIGGKWVAISPAAVKHVDWNDGRIEVALTRDEIKHAPMLETLDLPPSEAWPNYAYIF